MYKFIIYFFLGLLFMACKNENNNKLFTQLSTSTTGVTFKNLVQETSEFNVLNYSYFYNGGGVSIGDINNDGLADIYFTGNMVGSHLYLNKGGFEFVEIAKQAGVFAEGLWNTGSTMADVNGDGLLDIYVCRSAAKNPDKRENLLFINNGDLTFSEKSEEYGVNDNGYSTQGAFFDYDKDGDLDLFVLNHSTQQYAGFGQITASLKRRKNPAFSDKLYRNDDGRFTEVGQEAGLTSNVLGFGLGLAISDINNDDWPDIYISNDYNEQDYLYINNHDGTFSENLEKYVAHTSLFSMGSDIADVNNDGYTDILTLDMLPEGNRRQKMVLGPDNYDKYQRLVNSGFSNQTMRNMLQLNNQGQSFSEIGQFSGISNTDWSWASLFVDLDNDGFKDIFITNGYKRDYTNMDFMNFAVQEKLKENRTGKQTAIMDLVENIPSTIEENYTYRNNGDLTFTKVNEAWGLNQESLSNGAAYADLDNDGDMDLVVNNTDQVAFIYRNNSDKLTPNNYVKFGFEGQGKNTFGVGTKVVLKLGDTLLSQELMPTRGFQSSVDHNMIFGLGEATNVDEVNVIWPDGKIQVLKNLEPNRTVILKQADAVKKESTIKSNKEAYFADICVDSLIDFKHDENNYNDFKREQLLPHKLSTQGPKIAKGDINKDGLEDLFVGGAKGQSAKIFIQDRVGKFIENTPKIFQEDQVSEDIGALFFDADNDDDLDLYVVSGGNDFTVDSAELQDRLYINDGRGNFSKSMASLPSMLTSGSCVSVGDMDADGDLDLFVGGRLVPGKYPTEPRSYILQNDGKGNFTDITAVTNTDLVNPGMVTDALWTDFNGDGNNDLIIVGEFMAVRLFENNKGVLNELADSSGLSNSSGWWNTISSGDFDNDGDIDYILGNFGHNSQLKASEKEPVELYVKDFDNNGALDPILCSYVMGESYPVFSKDDLIGQLSGLKGKYVNYSDYANAKITDVFSTEELKGARVYKATDFSTSYIENLGNSQFKISPLPSQAQFAPVYGILSEDFNGDGNLDILLAGNFFGTRVKYGRYDANKGVLMLGDGTGNFTTVNSMESGLNIDGEVRDIEIIKSGNEKIVLFARNNETIKTYRFTPKSE